MCLVMAAPHPVSSMQGEIIFRSSNILHLLGRFCFNKGTAELDVLIALRRSDDDTDNANFGNDKDDDGYAADGNSDYSGADTADGVSLLVCTERQFFHLHNHIAGACAATAASSPSSSATATATAASLAEDSSGCKVYPIKIGEHTRIFQDELYDVRYFLVRFCSGATGYEAAVKVQYLNQDYKHLSCEFAFFPNVYFVLAFLWVSTSGLWFFSWVSQRQQAVLLHRIMSIVPILQVVRAAVTQQLWGIVENQGVEKEWMNMMIYLATAVYKGVLFTVLLALAKGWLVLRWDMSITERRTLIFCMTWVTIASFTYELFQGLFLFLIVFVIIIVLRVIFTSIAYNYQILLVQYSIMEELHRPAIEIATCKELIKIYSGFRGVMGIYLFAVVLLQVVQSFVIDYQRAYVYPAATEAVDWALIIAVGWLFRSRSAPNPGIRSGGDGIEGEGVESDDGGGSRLDARRRGANKVVVVIHPSVAAEPTALKRLCWASMPPP